MSELDLAAIAARAAAATEGPWRAAEQTHDEWVGIQDRFSALGSMVASADAEFVAHARTDVPLLLAEVERLTDAIGFHVRREMAVDKVLDKVLGSEEADGAGQGMAADVHLLAQERDASDRRAEAAEALVAEKDAEIERLGDVAETNTAAYEYAVVERDEARAALADVTRERDDLRARVEAPSPGNCRALSDGGQVCERRYGHTGNHEAMTMLGRYIRWAEDATVRPAAPSEGGES